MIRIINLMFAKKPFNIERNNYEKLGQGRPKLAYLQPPSYLVANMRKMQSPDYQRLSALSHFTRPIISMFQPA